jgi:hypothetical protein
VYSAGGKVGFAVAAHEIAGKKRKAPRWCHIKKRCLSMKKCQSTSIKKKCLSMKKCESTGDQVNSKKGIVEEDGPEDEKRLQAQDWGVGSRNAKGFKSSAAQSTIVAQIGARIIILQLCLDT